MTQSSLPQFGITHLLVLTFFIAAAIASAPMLVRVLLPYLSIVFFGSSVAAGILFRWIGWELSRPAGRLSRHAIASVAGFLGFSLAFVALHYRGSLATLIQDCLEGLGLVTVIFGIAVAAGIEIGSRLLAEGSRGKTR